MNKINQLRAFLLIALIGLVSTLHAGIGVSLKGVDSHLTSSGEVELQLHFSTSAPTPHVFLWTKPSRTVFDFKNVMLATPMRDMLIKKANIDKIIVREAENKLRLVVHQSVFSDYSIEKRDNNLIIRFDKPINKVETPIQNINKAKTSLVPELTTPVWNTITESSQVKEIKQYWKPQQIKSNHSRELRKIDFRREADGSGKVILTLPTADTQVEVHRTGSTIRLLMNDVDVPKHLAKRLDVLDFATPVTYIETTQRQLGTKVVIYAKGNIEYKTERKGRNYQIIISKKLNPRLKKKKKVFKGEKLSLNFQDIEVRAVLQLLADFTDKNIVVSDSVDGSITVRLKDVPWDQALDIVLETKNLAMRENGNVIWVAPAAELAAKEQQELEALKRKNDLEPLITEYIAVNFAKAEDMAKLIRESKGDKAHSLLSRRGSVTLDERTNTLLIQDVEHQIEEIKKLVKALDVPVQQVLIESRIVVATDEFTKELGTKFGMTPVVSNNNTLVTASGSSNATNTITNSAITNISSTGSALPVTAPSLADRLSVNLPVAGAAGSLGFAVLAKDFLLDLELSALQAESKGEVIATPRVITSNQNTATIEQGVEIPYQQASSSGATNIAFKKAVLSMDVTPQITPDEHIVVDLKVHQDTVGQVFGDIPSINTRAVQTKVLVENGQTIVLGGVHEEVNLRSTTKVPVLGDLPVVGKLFRKTHKSNNKRELLIFVTPKIVDNF